MCLNLAWIIESMRLVKATRFEPSITNKSIMHWFPESGGLCAHLQGEFREFWL